MTFYGSYVGTGTWVLENIRNIIKYARYTDIVVSWGWWPGFHDCCIICGVLYEREKIHSSFI